MCVCLCGPQEYNHGMPQLVQSQTEYALVAASHDYILKAHMNKGTLFSTVM